MGAEFNNRLVATAGHVDHGKTTLLEALTGTNADRLEEEQQRGLTIDLGFASLCLGAYEVGFVDVPGHHRFVKNMVTGVGSIQGVLLVVAADEGWQRQTEEHLRIVDLLEPDFICVALTKVDRVDDELTLVVEAEVEENLASTDYAGMPIVPVSGKTGAGLDELRSNLEELLAVSTPPKDHGKPFLPVDRVFTVDGLGTVVTGSLSNGSISVGDDLTLLPDDQPVRIRSLQAYGGEKEVVHPGSRAACGVPDVDRGNVDRGMVVSDPDSGVVTHRADGVFHFPTRADISPRHDLEVMAYVGTTRREARLLCRQEGALTEDGLPVRLVWEEDLFLRPGDRVVLRDSGDQYVLGAVEVLEPSPTDRLQSSNYRDYLRALAPYNPTNYVEATLSSMNWCSLRSLTEGTPFSQATLEEAIDSTSVLRREEELVYRDDWLDQLLAEAAHQVQTHHESNPLSPGLLLEKSAVPNEQAARDLVTRRLSEVGLVQDGPYLREADFDPYVPDERRDEYSQLLKTLRTQALETDPPEELPGGVDLREFAVYAGDVVALTEERLIHREVLEDLVADLAQYFQSEGSQRLAEVRDFLDSSRKYVIPLMEHLDEEGYTIRNGDYREWVGPKQTTGPEVTSDE